MTELVGKKINIIIINIFCILKKIEENINMIRIDIDD